MAQLSDEQIDAVEGLTAAIDSLNGGLAVDDALAHEYLSQHYWQESAQAVVAREAAKRWGFGSWQPSPQISEVRCRLCQTTRRVAFTSWSASKTPGKDGCPTCLAANQERWLRQQDQEEERAAAETAEIQRLRNLPYQEYLQSEHWQSIRKAALRRAGFRCQLCNADAKLDVHHRSYERLGSELASDVFVLCRGCHDHHYKRQVELRDGASMPESDERGNGRHPAEPSEPSIASKGGLMDVAWGRFENEGKLFPAPICGGMAISLAYNVSANPGTFTYLDADTLGVRLMWIPDGKDGEEQNRVLILLPWNTIRSISAKQATTEELKERLSGLTWVPTT